MVPVRNAIIKQVAAICALKGGIRIRGKIREGAMERASVALHRREDVPEDVEGTQRLEWLGHNGFDGNLRLSFMNDSYGFFLS